MRSPAAQQFERVARNVNDGDTMPTVRQWYCESAAAATHVENRQLVAGELSPEKRQLLPGPVPSHCVGVPAGVLNIPEVSGTRWRLLHQRSVLDVA